MSVSLSLDLHFDPADVTARKDRTPGGPSVIRIGDIAGGNRICIYIGSVEHADALIEAVKVAREQQAALPPCGCPRGETGTIRHLKGTCTDPIVARLNWYAGGLIEAGQ